MKNYFDIEKLFKKQISGHCSPYIDKEYYEVNEELGKILQQFVLEHHLINILARIDFNTSENQTYVQLLIGNLTGEKINTEDFVQKTIAGITCSVSLLAPVFTISQEQWLVTSYLSTNQEIETFPSPNYTAEEAFTLYPSERKLITNYLESKGLISFQDVTVLFPEIGKNVLFKSLFLIND